jgi:hypothetical protein
MRNPRRIDSCLNCKHCETVAQWDWAEYNCLHEAPPKPILSADRKWREAHGVDPSMICEAWENMK